MKSRAFFYAGSGILASDFVLNIIYMLVYGHTFTLPDPSILANIVLVCLGSFSVTVGIALRVVGR